MRAAILLTCFNRKDKTLSCLKSVYMQARVKDLTLTIYLVDDGSNDGTSIAVSNAYPEINILVGDGHLYWNGGMNLAWRAAFKERYDYYIWINDDIEITSDAFRVMFETFQRGYSRSKTKPVVVGCFCDPDSGEHAYGGFLVKKSIWGITSQRLVPHGEIARCDTFNGNLVLIPNSVVKDVGVLDERYTHAFGDKDYGFRCTGQNIPMYITPKYIGTCSRNSINGTWMDPGISLGQRHKKLWSPTGLPPTEYFYSYKKNCSSFAGGIALIKLYSRMLFPNMWSYISRRASGE